MTSTMPSPDRKRPRVEATDDEESQGSNNIEHPALYFRDGNVILRCRGTDFRVHNTLLSKNSPVFENLFATHELNIDKEHPGCIVVPLDDDADDIEILLHRVYDGFHIGTPKLNVATFPSLTSLLRTSTKYEIQRPRDTIFEIFHREWPSELDLYDKVVAARTHSNHTDNVHPAAVITILLECGYSSSDLLKPLFYELTTCVWRLGDPPSGNYLAKFSSADIQRFLVGLDGLRSLQARLAICPVDDIPHPSCRSCLTSIWCHTTYPILANKKDGNYHPLRDWEELISLFSTEQSSADDPPNPPAHAHPAAPPPPYQTPPIVHQVAQNPPPNPVHNPAGMVYYQAGAQVNPQPNYHAGPGPLQVAGQVGPQLGYRMGQAFGPPLVQYMQPQLAHRILPPPVQTNPTMCPSCKRTILTHLQACRQKIWDSITTLFNLG